MDAIEQEHEFSTESKKVRFKKMVDQNGLPRYTKPIAAAAVLVVVAGVAFFGGVAYERGQVKHMHGVTTGGQFSGAGFGGRSGFRRGVFGTVTAVSNTSITVQDQRTGTTATYVITSTTAIVDNGSTVTASDIQNGDTVMVRVSTANTSQAATIEVNPSFGGVPSGSGSAATNVGPTSST